jgi:hypothetical protein
MYFYCLSKQHEMFLELDDEKDFQITPAKLTQSFRRTMKQTMNVHASEDLRKDDPNAPVAQRLNSTLYRSRNEGETFQERMKRLMTKQLAGDKTKPMLKRPVYSKLS